MINVYIPEILGKEKRKIKPSAEGTLGVEGVDKEILISAFEKAGITASERRQGSDITKLTLYELGLSGGENSRELREKLQLSLGLPHQLSTGALVEVLCTMMNSEELRTLTEKIKEDNDGI